jgi:hypothetical protein
MHLVAPANQPTLVQAGTLTSATAILKRSNLVTAQLQGCKPAHDTVRKLYNVSNYILLKYAMSTSRVKLLQHT